MNAFGLFVIRLDLWHIPRNIASKLRPLQEPVAMMIGSEWHPADHTKANLLVVGVREKVAGGREKEAKPLKSLALSPTMVHMYIWWDVGVRCAHADAEALATKMQKQIKIAAT